MKSSLPKIFFILFVISLIGVSVYFVYNNPNKNTVEDTNKVAEVEPEIFHDLRLGIASFDTINPILSTNREVQEIARVVYEPLVTLNEKYEPVACLATEWSKIENNGYIIKLRQGVKWHNGTDFTAYDVKFTIDKLKEEALAFSIYAANVRNITNLEVVDDYTVKLTLDSDVPFFEYYLTFPILSASFFDGQDFITTTQNKNPVGTGKYKASWNENDILVLKKNNNYWEKEDDVNLENIYVYFYSTMGEMYNSFKIGNIDLITTQNLFVEDYIGTIGYNRKDYQGREFDFLAFNTKSNVLAHTEIRKAISYAIDKTILNTNVYNNKYYLADFPLDYNNWLYNQNSVSSGYNPAQVNVILAENGWELRNGVWQKKENYTTIKANINLVVNASDAQRVSICESIKQQLADVGILVTIKSVSDSQYQNYWVNKNYDMILTGTSGIFNPDMSIYLGEGNLSNFENEELRSLVTEVKNISDKNLLIEKYNRIYEIYKENMPFFSLYFNRTTLCYSPYLMGEITPNCFNIFYNIEKWYRQY